MKISLTTDSVTQIAADAVVIGVCDNQQLQDAALQVDQASQGLLARLIEEREIDTTPYACTKIMHFPGMRSHRLVVVGLPPSAELSAGVAYKACGAAAKFLSGKARSRVACYLDTEPWEDAIAGWHVGAIGQDLFRATKKTFPIDEVVFPQRDQVAATHGIALGEAINLTRLLVNLPPNMLYPKVFVDHCQAVARANDMQIEIWDSQKLAAENCRALLAVGQAAAHEPYLVVLQYKGNPNSNEHWGWIGKGVTFDSGGLSIKPSESMLDMKCDMAGAATVLGALQAVAQMKLRVNITAVVGLVENMIGGNSYRLGDVITARNGTTIEIHNTDAEGRLVLADCLDVAISRGANHLVDLATLTGACMVALGRFVAGGMTNHPAWYARLARAADECGEPLWQLPMFADYRDQIRSQVADIKNVGDGRWGGAITAAKFLQEFVRDVPWVHLDIAGPSFQDKPSAWVDAGASGVFVRTLVRMAEESQD